MDFWQWVPLRIGLLGASFSVVLLGVAAAVVDIVGGAARLLDARGSVVRVVVIFTIAASDVWQFVGVSFPVHRVREALAVAGLVH